MASLENYYDKLAGSRDRYIKRYSYYHSLLHKYYRYYIPKGKRVLEVGCGTGELLNALSPSFGVGVDLSQEMVNICKQKFSHLSFYTGNISELDINERFDYVVLSGLMGELEDIQGFLTELRRFCHPGTRIVIEY